MALPTLGWFNSLWLLVTRPAFIWLNGLTLGVLGALGWFAKASGKSYRFVVLFKDPYAGGPFYQAFFTNFSEVIWCIALAICLFCFGLMKSLGRRYDWFFLATAAVIAMLLLDDMQRISLVAKYGLGVPKIVMYGLYVTVIAIYAWLFRRRIAKDTPYPLLLIMVGMFAISATSDVFGNAKQQPGRFALFEDGTKLIGLVNLMLYCWLVGQQEIKRLIIRPAGDRPRR